MINISFTLFNIKNIQPIAWQKLSTPKGVIMETKVKIVADSTCDLSPDLLSKYDIEVIPLPVNLGDKPCLDGVDVHVQDIFDYYNETGELATTSAPTPAYYENFYKKWTDEGYTVVHTNLSLKFTATHNNAKIAAEKFPGVYPIDSRNLSSGMGLLAIKGAVLRDEGLPAWQIADKLREEAYKTQTSFVLDTLKYMHKGGRCSGVALMGANMLNLKPCLVTKDGMLVVGKKYRGKLEKVLMQYTSDMLSSGEDIDTSMLLITHSGVDKDIVKAVKKNCEKTLHFDHIEVCEAGCSVCVHCGPNTLGLIYSKK